MRQPYEIWECQQCGQRVASDRLQRGRSMERAFVIALGKSVDDLPRTHRRLEARGSGRPGVIGCHMVDVDCGPVEKRTVGLQEQFLEWLETEP